MPMIQDLEQLEEDQAREIERIDAGGNAWEGTEPVEVEVRFKRPLGKVVPVRLSDEHWKQLYAEAKELGVGPSTLMRMWVLEKLRSVREERRQPARR